HGRASGSDLGSRSHAERGNAVFAAPRRRCPGKVGGRPSLQGATQSVADVRSHAERGNEERRSYSSAAARLALRTVNFTPSDPCTTHSVGVRLTRAPPTGRVPPRRAWPSAWATPAG